MILILFSIWLPLSLFIYDFWWVYSKIGDSFFKPRVLLITPQKIVAVDPNNNSIDSTSEESIHSIYKKVELRSYWLIYPVKSKLLIIPKAAFQKESDELEFKKILQNAG